MKENYATMQILYSSTWDAVDKTHNAHSDAHTTTHIHLISNAATHFIPLLQAKFKRFPDNKVYKSH